MPTEMSLDGKYSNCLLSLLSFDLLYRLGKEEFLQSLGHPRGNGKWPLGGNWLKGVIAFTNFQTKT